MDSPFKGCVPSVDTPTPSWDFFNTDYGISISQTTHKWSLVLPETFPSDKRTVVHKKPDANPSFTMVSYGISILFLMVFQQDFGFEISGGRGDPPPGHQNFDFHILSPFLSFSPPELSRLQI